MMKKISIFFLALILIFSMAGCGAESDPQTSGPADRVESETDTEPADITAGFVGHGKIPINPMFFVFLTHFYQ